jgi:nucleoside-specific outer membrane channel protein Tsx
MTRLDPRISTFALAGALLAAPALAHAATWSDTFIGYRYGTDFREPNNPRDVEKHILQFSHASGYSIGQNFVNLDIFQSDKADPTERGGSNGATEFYLTYRHQVHLGKAFGRSLAFGPVKEVAITAGFDLNTKNSPVQPRKRLLVVGPTLKFDVPGFLDVSLLLGKEWNHNNFGSVEKEIAFDPQWIISAAWGIPFNAGPVPLKFQGFANYLSKRGEDYNGKKTKAETLMRTSLMVDVGQMAWGKKNTLLMGVGYEYWRNKFGNHGIQGVDVDAPTFQMEWHF